MTAAFSWKPTDPVAAFQANAIGAKDVAKWAERMGATVAYSSTDYVFDGKKGSPYLEADVAAPLNVYGITKLAGEHFTAAISTKYFILRVSAPFIVYSRAEPKVG